MIGPGESCDHVSDRSAQYIKDSVGLRSVKVTRAGEKPYGGRKVAGLPRCRARRPGEPGTILCLAAADRPGRIPAYSRCLAGVLHGILETRGRDRQGCPSRPSDSRPEFSRRGGARMRTLLLSAPPPWRHHVTDGVALRAGTGWLEPPG